MTASILRTGIRFGLIIGMLGLINVYLSTMTGISRSVWSAIQGGFPMVILYLCGWAGVKVYPETKSLWQAGLAAGIAALLGVALFNGSLLAVAMLLKDSVKQFPFAAEDLVKKQITPAAYLSSPEGVRDLTTSALHSFFLIPMAAGFGAVGALVTQSITTFRKGDGDGPSES